MDPARDMKANREKEKAKRYSLPERFWRMEGLRDTQAERALCFPENISLCVHMIHLNPFQSHNRYCVELTKCLVP